MSELKTSRRMTATFLKTETESFRKMQELQQRLDMANEDRRTDKASADVRMNMLIREFVIKYKKLAKEFLTFKDFA